MIEIEPTKKSFTSAVFAFIGILVVMLICLQIAVVIDTTKPQLDKNGKTSINYSVVLKNFSERIQKKPFDIKITKSSKESAEIGGFICLMAFLMVYSSKRNLIRGKEYGTAKWGTSYLLSKLRAEPLLKAEIKSIKKRKMSAEAKKEAIKKAKEKYKNSEMLFTKTEKICMYNYELNNNTLIIGGSGSGKTRGFVMPNLLQAHSSYIITDPKGEILEKSGSFFEKEGYKIRVLNLDDKTTSTGYNPFHYIHKERADWESRVLSLIETIIVNTNGAEQSKGGDPFFDKGEKLFLQSIFFGVVTAFKENEANMNTVHKLINWLEIGEQEDLRDSKLDKFFNKFKEEYGEDHIGYQQFIEFRSKASGKTAKSIVISAVARLAPFKVKEIKRIFAYDDMHLERIGEEKTVVFVIVPPTDKTFNFVAGILFTQIFQELNHCALNVHKHDGQKLPVMCRFILDEFANTCTIPNFISILAYARSLGVGITVILQSLEQIKKMYEKDWGVLIDNCNTLLYLGKVTHMETLKYLSELLGKGTYDKDSRSKSRGKQSSNSTNEDKIGRELLDPSEIRKIDNKKCLFIVGGKDPFYSEKYNYKNHKNYKFTSDGNKKLSYTYKPKLPKDEKSTTVSAVIKDKEDLRIKQELYTKEQEKIKRLLEQKQEEAKKEEEIKVNNNIDEVISNSSYNILISEFDDDYSLNSDGENVNIEEFQKKEMEELKEEEFMRNINKRIMESEERRLDKGNNQILKEDETIITEEERGGVITDVETDVEEIEKLKKLNEIEDDDEDLNFN